MKLIFLKSSQQELSIFIDCGQILKVMAIQIQFDHFLTWVLTKYGQYLARDLKLEGVSCKTDLFLMVFRKSGCNFMKALYFLHSIPLTYFYNIICWAYFRKFFKNLQKSSLPSQPILYMAKQ